ncbi:unknown [Clostridium sp. CAG:448]|nr:unknown [Clostridium sp. CAG:448]
MHGFSDRIRDVMQFQIQEDPVSARFDLPHDVRSLRVKELHSDFHEQLLSVKPIQKRVDFFRAVKIQRNNHFTLCLFHLCATPIISFRFSIPYFCITAGSCSTIR